MLRDATRSGPELTLESRFSFVDRAFVGTGRHVLPAAVGDAEGDLRRSARLHTAGCLRQSRMQDGSGRDPREDALFLEELPRTPYGVSRAHREPRIDERLVVQLRDEALVEIAQSVHELPVPGFGGDDAHVGLVLAEEATCAHQSP